MKEKKVYKCPICGTIRNSKGELFEVTSSPASKMRIMLHIAVAHPTKDAEKWKEKIKVVHYST